MNIWRVKKTSTGVVYIFFLLLISGASVNTGNNTLYVTAATMMGVLIFSGLVSIFNLTAFEITGVKAGEFYAGQPGQIEIRIRNRRKWSLVQGLYLNGRPVSPIERGGEIRAGVDMTFPERGRVDSLSITISSSYPFGFFSRERRFDLPIPLIIYPAPKSTRRCDALQWKGEGEKATTVDRIGERAFKGLKAFQEGDDPRAIHWKKSAQKQLLIAREFLFLHSGNFIFRIPPGLSGAPFEESLQYLTYCILRSLKEGRPVGLKHGEDFIKPGAGPAQRRKILTYLALVEG